MIKVNNFLIFIIRYVFYSDISSFMGTQNKSIMEGMDTKKEHMKR